MYGCRGMGLVPSGAGVAMWVVYVAEVESFGGAFGVASKVSAPLRSVPTFDHIPE